MTRFIDRFSGGNIKKYGLGILFVPTFILCILFYLCIINVYNPSRILPGLELKCGCKEESIELVIVRKEADRINTEKNSIESKLTEAKEQLDQVNIELGQSDIANDSLLRQRKALESKIVTLKNKLHKSDSLLGIANTNIAQLENKFKKNKE